MDEDKTPIEKEEIALDLDATYFNGFSLATGIGDIIITLFRNGKPIRTLNTSYTVAKTLSLKLSQSIQKLEKETGNEIMTTDYVMDKLIKKTRDKK